MSMYYHAHVLVLQTGDWTHGTAGMTSVTNPYLKGRDTNLCVVMSPPEGLGDILFFPGRPSVRMSVCLSVTNRVRSVT